MGATLREAGYGIEKESLHLAAWYDRARLFLLGQLCLCALMHSEESRLAIRWSAFFVTAFGLIRKLLECSEKELRRSFRSDVRRAPGCLHASRETFSSQSPSTHHTKSSPKTRFFPSFQCGALYLFAAPRSGGSKKSAKPTSSRARARFPRSSTCRGTNATHLLSVTTPTSRFQCNLRQYLVSALFPGRRPGA